MFHYPTQFWVDTHLLLYDCRARLWRDLPVTHSKDQPLLWKLRDTWVVFGRPQQATGHLDCFVLGEVMTNRSTFVSSKSDKKSPKYIKFFFCKTQPMEKSKPPNLHIKPFHPVASEVTVTVISSKIKGWEVFYENTVELA